MSLLCEVFKDVKSICVNTGEVVINKKDLVTGFVKTCSILAFTYQKTNFLAHIDSMEPNMEEKINQKIKELNPGFIKHIFIWKGSSCNNNCPSFILAKKIANKLNGKIIFYKANDDTIKIESNKSSD